MQCLAVTSLLTVSANICCPNEMQHVWAPSTDAKIELGVVFEVLV